MTRKLFVIALGLALFVAPGCATVFSGSTDAVNFSSEPTGANVYVNGQMLGKTPFEVVLKSDQSHNVEFRKSGFENKTVVLTNSVGAGWVVLDIVFGLIPVVVDAASGAWYGLDQDHVAAALEPVENAPPTE